MLIISKKKKSEFDTIFILFNNNNFTLDIDLFRKISESDFFDHFLEHIKEKINNVIIEKNIFYLHVKINSFVMSDLYLYDKILKFAKSLQEFTNNLPNIYIYDSSAFFTNLLYLLNNSLGIDIGNKIIFESTQKYNEIFLNQMKNKTQ